MAKTYYIVTAIRKSAQINIHPNMPAYVDLSTLADGCCGVCLCFTNKRKAQNYAAGKCPIVEAESIPPVKSSD